MNIPGYTQRYTGTAGSVGVTPVEIAITLPNAPPAEGFMYGVQLKEVGGPLSTMARCEIYEQSGGRLIASYDDGSGGLIPIDTTGDAFDFADTRVFYVRAAGTFVVKVWTDDAGDASTIQAEVTLGGNG